MDTLPKNVTNTHLLPDTGRSPGSEVRGPKSGTADGRRRYGRRRTDNGRRNCVRFLPYASSVADAGPWTSDPGPAPGRLTVAQIVRSLEVGGGEMLAAGLAERLDRTAVPLRRLLSPGGGGWRASRQARHSGGRVWRRRGRQASARGPRATRPAAGAGGGCALPQPDAAPRRRPAAARRPRPALLMTKHGMTFWRGRRQEALARFLLRRAVSVAVSNEVSSAMIGGRAGRAGADHRERHRSRAIPRGGRATCGEARVGLDVRRVRRRHRGAPGPRERPREPLARLRAVRADRAARAAGGHRRCTLGARPWRRDAAELRVGDRCHFLGERRDIPQAASGPGPLRPLLHP